MNKLLYAALGLIALTAAVALIGPSFVDWNVYKDRVVGELRDATGRDLTIGGAIHFAVLPSPAFSAGQVQLANLADGSPEPLLDLEELRIRVAFWPLLQGRLQVESVSLVAPRLLLEVLPDGRRNWELAPAESAGTDGQGDAEPALLAEVVIDSFIIREGSLTYRDARDGRQERIEALEAEVVADSLTGPYALKGRGRLRGIDTTFDVATGRLHSAGATPFKVILGLPAAEARFEFGGAFSRHPDSFRYRGMARASGDSLAALADHLGWTGQRAGLSPEAAQPFSLSADVSGDQDILEAAELEFLLAEARLTGDARWRFQPAPAFQLTLSGARIDLDRLMVDQAASAPASAVPATAPDDRAAMAEWWRQLELPTDLNGEFALAVDGLVLHDRTLRQLRFDATLDKGLLIVEQASIELPGGSRLRANGIVTNQVGGPRFSGAIEAGSEDLRGLVSWLGLAVEDLPADRFRRLSLGGQLVVDAQEIRLDKAELQVDLSRISGGIVAALRSRVGLGIGLAVDRLNLDAYLAPAAVTAQDGESAAAGTDSGDPLSPAALFGAWPAGFDLFDANLDLRVGKLIYRGQALQNVQLNGTLRDGALSLRQTRIGDLAGAQLDFSGILSGLTQAPRIDGSLDLKARDGSRFLRAVGLDAAAIPPLGAFSAKATLQGAPDALAFNTELAALGGTLEMVGTAKLATKPLSYGLQLALRHPEVAAFLRALGRDVPHDAQFGSLALTAQARGADQQIRFEDLALAAGRVQLAGSLLADLAGDRPRVTAVLSGGEVNGADLTGLGAGLAMADSHSGRPAVRSPSRESPLDLSTLNSLDGEFTVTLRSLVTEDLRLDDLALQAKLTDGVLEVERLIATVHQGTLELTGRLAAPSLIQASVDFTLRDVAAEALLARWLPVEVAAGALNLEASLTSSGPSRAQLMANLSGQGQLDGQLALAVPDPKAEGLSVAGLQEAARLIGDAFGGTPARLEGSFRLQGGEIDTEDVLLTGEGAWAKVRAVADLPGAILDSTTEIFRVAKPETPYLTVRLTGALDEPDLALKGEPFQRKPAPQAGTEAPAAESSPPQELPLDAAIEDLLKDLEN